MNPYTPPNASLEATTPGGAVTAQRAAEIERELKSLNLKSFALAIPGLVLQGVAQGMPGVTGYVVAALGTALLIGGYAFYAKMRGRSPVFSLLGLVSCLGLLVLYFLPKGCLNCQTSNSFGAKHCSRCGAPLGA